MMRAKCDGMVMARVTASVMADPSAGKPYVNHLQCKFSTFDVGCRME
jgi:hypothetical protein